MRIGDLSFFGIGHVDIVIDDCSVYSSWKASQSFLIIIIIIIY